QKTYGQSKIEPRETDHSAKDQPHAKCHHRDDRQCDPTPNPTLAAMTTAKNTLQTKFNAVHAGKIAQEQKVTEQGVAEAALDALLTTPGGDGAERQRR